LFQLKANQLKTTSSQAERSGFFMFLKSSQFDLSLLSPPLVAALLANKAAFRLSKNVFSYFHIK